MLLESNHIAEWREIALGHVVKISFNIKVTESILMEFDVFM